jgi:hypothetical protein
VSGPVSTELHSIPAAAPTAMAMPTANMIVLRDMRPVSGRDSVGCSALCHTTQPPISASMREWVLSRARWSGPGLGVVVRGDRCWWAGPAPYPGSGVRRFGAWASIRSAPAVGRVVCVERCGHSSLGWAQSHTRPAPAGGVMPIGELASDRCARTVHAATWSRQRICPSRSP